MGTYWTIDGSIAIKDNENDDNEKRITKGLEFLDVSIDEVKSNRKWEEIFFSYCDNGHYEFADEIDTLLTRAAFTMKAFVSAEISVHDADSNESVLYKYAPSKRTVFNQKEFFVTEDAIRRFGESEYVMIPLSVFNKAKLEKYIEGTDKQRIITIKNGVEEKNHE